ncbi:arylsulfotransferase family protein [Haloarcula sp. JP-L23]|uniref:arylsulfotransferase family protein n=1 Tax=Haloarcula sp. JP-L23 TaxID=2716717 RepID=UPI00140EC79D|nr:arylsulfotransferase (asst) [Haloarcula sp. JP-L23]
MIVVNVRLGLRALMLAVILSSFATVAGAFAAAEDTATDPADAFEVGERAVDPPGDTTVITTSQHGNNFLVAFDPDGTVAYYDGRYAFYNEVERVPGTESIVYVATERLDRAECHATEPCNRNVIERLNLTTGERELLYERTNPRDRNQWHAIALVDDRHVAVGDIAYDRVFVLDTETEMIEWEWEAQSDFDRSGGGVYPGDWTHLNDVEALPDGRVMISLRNQDQIVFIDPDDGLQRSWTLGADDDHSVLYEQHNPDYIPSAGGGPAVLVADSENNRIVEYERQGGEWRETWSWSDAELRWPRDADRLSNGHTMVVDSNGAHVLELDQDNDIVWSVAIKGAYDVERFDARADRKGVETATRLGLASSDGGNDAARDVVPEPRAVPKGSLAVLEGILPSVVVNGLLYVLPPWFGVRELAATFALACTATVWAGIELRWRGYHLRTPIARRDG